MKKNEAIDEAIEMLEHIKSVFFQDFNVYLGYSKSDFNRVINGLSIEDAQKEQAQNENKIAKKFGTNAMQELNEMCIGTAVNFEIIEDFIKYRNEIKKPMKTIRPVKDYAQQLIMIAKAGYDLTEVIETMKTAEWQTVKLHWIKNTIKATKAGADLAQFGFNQNTQEQIK